ncbi:Fe2OG dioxygenase domain-containing protein [Mycena sanguinolenta]|uniref:Fe2OG dioxygenase domain-containing protein n=1 Tax=Mycena sanguinolenta TaxID=230812 RepID=A0A8H6XDT4_9AGAR|nr:Fe2OG dioxygenase domain-containing protein [Mycena sanguinolenta]
MLLNLSQSRAVQPFRIFSQGLLPYSSKARRQSPQVFSPAHLQLSQSRSCRAHVTDIDNQLVLRKSLRIQVPYTAGVCAVKPEALIVYYDSDGENSPRRIDLGKATEDGLVELTAACQKATFGVAGANVLDDSYRKAGKMNPERFATSTSLGSLRPAELYKLNVYGPGSFFKAHKDTPRSKDMIGSLVVVFPTGGALTLEHNRKIWVLDSAKELASAWNTPSLARDIALHLPTTSSSRIGTQLQAPAKGNATYPCPSRPWSRRYALFSPTFLPAGGFLAFGLTHQYLLPAPAKPKWNARTSEFTLPPSRFGSVLRCLKGSHARIRIVSERIGLSTHVKIL